VVMSEYRRIKPPRVHSAKRVASQTVFLFTGGNADNILFSGRVNRSKKVVDDGNLTAFIIRYRYLHAHVLSSYDPSSQMLTYMIKIV
jgi:hypothetical protein